MVCCTRVDAVDAGNTNGIVLSAHPFCVTAISIDLVTDTM